MDLNIDNDFEFTANIEKDVIMISALQMTDVDVMKAGKEISELTYSHNETE